METIIHHQKLGWKTKEFLAILLMIKTKTYGVIITSVYCPPECTFNKKQQYLNFLNGQRDRFIVDGNFNVKHTDWGQDNNKHQG